MRHGTWLACETGSKHVLKRDLESVLGVSARVESERTGFWTRLSHVPSRRMGLQSTFSRPRRLECHLMRKNAVNISIRSFSSPKKGKKENKEKGKSIRMAICMAQSEGTDNTMNGVSLGRA